MDEPTLFHDQLLATKFFVPLRKHVTMRTLRTFEQALSQSGGRKYRKQTFRVRRA